MPPALSAQSIDALRLMSIRRRYLGQENDGAPSRAASGQAGLATICSALSACFTRDYRFGCDSLRFAIRDILVRGLTSGLQSLAASSFLCSAVLANDVQPRLYNNVPVGANFISLSYTRSKGEVSFDDSVPVEDVEGEIDSFLVSYSRGLDIGGKSGLLTFVVPYTDIALEGLYFGLPASGQRQGFGDPVVRLALNLYGAPALRPEEFRSFQAKTIVGVNIAVGMPLGRYDKNRLLNNGANRWTFTGQIGGSHRVGKWELEGALGVSWATDNDQLAGSNRLEQDPIGLVRGGVLYHFAPGVWLGAGLIYLFGGATSLNGEERDNRYDNWRSGAAFSFPLSRTDQIQLRVTDGIASRIGGDFTNYSIAYTHVF